MEEQLALQLLTGLKGTSVTRCCLAPPMDQISSHIFLAVMLGSATDDPPETLTS
jgi:hypothetical protein